MEAEGWHKPRPSVPTVIVDDKLNPLVKSVIIGSPNVDHQPPQFMIGEFVYRITNPHVFQQWETPIDSAFYTGIPAQIYYLPYEYFASTPFEFEDAPGVKYYRPYDIVISGPEPILEEKPTPKQTVIHEPFWTHYTPEGEIYLPDRVWKLTPETYFDKLPLIVKHFPYPQDPTRRKIFFARRKAELAFQAKMDAWRLHRKFQIQQTLPKEWRNKDWLPFHGFAKKHYKVSSRRKPWPLPEPIKTPYVGDWRLDDLHQKLGSSYMKNQQRNISSFVKIQKQETPVVFEIPSGSYHADPFVHADSKNQFYMIPKIKARQKVQRNSVPIVDELFDKVLNFSTGSKKVWDLLPGSVRFSIITHFSTQFIALISCIVSLAAAESSTQKVAAGTTLACIITSLVNILWSVISALNPNLTHPWELLKIIAMSVKDIASKLIAQAIALFDSPRTPRVISSSAPSEHPGVLYRGVRYQICHYLPTVLAYSEEIDYSPMTLEKASNMSSADILEYMQKNTLQDLHPFFPFQEGIRYRNFGYPIPDPEPIDSDLPDTEDEEAIFGESVFPRIPIQPNAGVAEAFEEAESATKVLPWIKLGTFIVTLIGSLVCSIVGLNSENKKTWDFAATIGKHLTNSGSTLRAIFGDEVSLVGLVTDIFGDAKCTDTLKMKNLVNEMSELLSLPIIELKAREGAIDRLFALPEESSRLMETIKSNRKNSAAVRGLSGLLVTMHTNIVSRIQEVKMLEAASVRPDPTCVLLAGPAAVGKSKFMRHIFERVRDVMDYKHTNMYILNKSAEQKHWNTYLGQEVAQVDEFAFRPDKDSVIDNFNQIFSSAPMVLQGASLSEKKQHFESRLVLMTSNIQEKSQGPQFTNTASTAAVWSRIHWIEVNDPIVEAAADPRYLEFPHRRPDFSHLRLTLKNSTPAKLKGNINSEDRPVMMTPEQLVTWIVKDLAKREIAWLTELRNNYGDRIPRIDDQHFQERLSYCQGIRQHFAQRIVQPNAGRDFCVFRFQGTPGSGKTGFWENFAPRLAVLFNYPLKQVYFDTALTPCTPSERKNPCLYILDDQPIEDQKNQVAFTTWMNSTHPKSVFIICTNYQHDLKKPLTSRLINNFLSVPWYKDFTFGSSSLGPLLTQKVNYYDVPGEYYPGAIRRLGLPGLHWMQDRWEAVDARYSSCITMNPGQLLLDGKRASEAQIHQVMFSKVREFIANAYGDVMIKTEPPTSEYQIIIHGATRKDLLTCLTSKTAIARAFAGSGPVKFSIVGNISALSGQVDPETFVMQMDPNENEADNILLSLLSRIIRLSVKVNIQITTDDGFRAYLVDSIIYSPQTTDADVSLTLPFGEFGPEATVHLTIGHSQTIILTGMDILRVMARDYSTVKSMYVVEAINKALRPNGQLSHEWATLFSSSYHQIERDEARAETESSLTSTPWWPIIASLVALGGIILAGWSIYKKYFTSQEEQEGGPTYNNVRIYTEQLYLPSELDERFWNPQSKQFDLPSFCASQVPEAKHSVIQKILPQKVDSNGARHPKSNRISRRLTDEEYSHFIAYLERFDSGKTGFSLPSEFKPVYDEIVANKRGVKGGRAGNRAGRRMTDSEYDKYLEMLARLDRDPRTAFDYAKNNPSIGVHTAMGWTAPTGSSAPTFGEQDSNWRVMGNNKPSAQNGATKEQNDTYIKATANIVDLQGREHKDFPEGPRAFQHSHKCTKCQQVYSHRHSKIKIPHDLLCKKCEGVSPNSINTITPVSPQQDIVEQFARKIEKNTVIVSTGEGKCHGIVLQDRQILTVAHIVRQDAEKDPIKVEFDLNGAPYAGPAKILYVNRARDLCLCELMDKKIPAFPNLTKHFAPLEDVEQQHSMAFVQFYQGSAKIVTGVMRAYRDTPFNYTSPEENYLHSKSSIEFIPQGFTFNSEFIRRGDCGLPAIGLVANQPKIFGIHNGFVRNGTKCLFSYYTSEDFAHVGKNSTKLYTFNSFGEPVYMTEELASICSDLRPDGFQAPGIECRGTKPSLRDAVNDKPHKFCLGDEGLKCKIASGFAPQMVEQVVDKSGLYYNEIKQRHSIGFSQFKKFGETIPDAGELDEECFEKAAEYMDWYYKRQYGEIKILTQSQVINGIRNPRDKMFAHSSGLDMKTSPGLVFSKIFKDSSKGDAFINAESKPEAQPFYVPDLTKPSGIYLQNTLDTYWEALGKGMVCVSGAKACLKQEILPLEKVKKGGTRMFQAVDTDRIILRGRITRGLMWTQFANRHNSVARGGANIYLEATEMRNYMEEILGTEVFGDFSRFDKYMIKRICLRYALTRFRLLPEQDQTEENKQRFLAEAEGQVKSIQVMDGSVMIANRGNLSGQADTLPINDWGNHFSFMYCLMRRLKDQGKCLDDYDFLTIMDMYRLITTGDDNWSKFVPELEMSFEVLKKYFAEIGMLFTDSGKGLSDDETFCSRLMKRDADGFVYPALKKSSIERQLHFSADLTPEQLSANFRGVLLEAALWDQKYYNIIKQDVDTQLINLDRKYGSLGSQVRSRINFRPYHAMRTIWASYIRGVGDFPEVSPLVTTVENEEQMILTPNSVFTKTPSDFSKYYQSL